MSLRAAASRYAAAAAALAAAGLPFAARAEPPSAQAAQIAMMDALDRVCRPAAESQQAPDAFAQAAGYAPTPVPPHIPLTDDPSVRAWRAPSPVGRLYVVAGVLPQVATRSACTVALYDAVTPGLASAVRRYLDRLRPGFTLNTAQSGTSRTLALTRFDRPVSKTVHTVVVADVLKPQPEGPTEIVSALTVDFSWRKGR